MKKILVIGLLAVLVLSVMATGMVRKFTRDGECGGRNVVAVCQNYGGNDEQFYAQGAPSSVSTTDLYIEASCEGEWECSDYNAKTIKEMSECCDGCVSYRITVVKTEEGYTGGGGGPNAECQ